MINSKIHNINNIKESKIKNETKNETKINENNIKDQLNIIQSSNLENLQYQNENLNSPVKTEGTDSIKAIRTINDDKEMVNGITFKYVKVVNDKGEIVLGKFPDFTKVKISTVQLPTELEKATDFQQNKFCNEKLKEMFENGELNTDDLSDRQIEQIKNGDKPKDYTWHHNEKKGIMELVPSRIHSNVGHTGGKSIWGGGTKAR